MTESAQVRSPAYMPPTPGVSLMEIATHLLKRRRFIFVCALAGAGLGVVAALLTPVTYTARASFTPATSEGAQMSGLSSLAGQLGLSVPGSSGAQGALYVELLRSRALLGALATDTMTVTELGPPARSLINILEIKQGNPDETAERLVKALSTATDARLNTTTQVVTVTMTSRWRSVSLHVVDRMLQLVNEFNIRSRQAQAAQERRFVEGRLAAARQDQRAAEDKLEAFLEGNRGSLGAPELTFARDRLQREVTLQQSLVSQLAQDYESVRIREVRDTPVINTLESPFVPTTPDPRRRLLKAIAGLLFGSTVGIIVVLINASLAHRRKAGDPTTEEFLSELRSARSILPASRARTETRQS